MLDLFIAHDLIQKRANDRFEGTRVESNVRGAGQEQRPSRDTVSDLGVDSRQRLRLGGPLLRMRLLITNRRSTTRTAAES
jgi:hypothetical protein